MKHWKEIIVGNEIKIRYYPDEDEEEYNFGKPLFIEAVIVDAEISYGKILRIKTLDQNGHLEEKTIYDLEGSFVKIFYKENFDIRRTETHSNSSIHLIFPIVGDYFNPITPCKRIPTTKVVEICGNKYKFEGDFRWFDLSEIKILRLPYPERLRF